MRSSPAISWTFSPLDWLPFGDWKPLSARFDSVDLVEPNERLLEQAKKEASTNSEFSWSHVPFPGDLLSFVASSWFKAGDARTERFIASSLEQFAPEEARR